MSERIVSALTACGLLDTYKKSFKENSVDDAMLDVWIETKEIETYLPIIISPVGHRFNFLTQFKNIKASISEHQKPSISEPQEQEEQVKEESDEEEEDASTFNSDCMGSPIMSEKNVDSSPSPDEREQEKEKTPRLTSKESMELAIKFYNERMNNLMIEEGQFYEESYLLQAHEETKIKSVELYQVSYDGFNSQSSQGKNNNSQSQENGGAEYSKMLIKDLNNTIDNSFKMLQMKNELNQTRYTAKAQHSLTNAENMYKSKLKKLMEDSIFKDEEEIISKENEVSDHVLNHFNETIENPCASQEFIQELNEQLKNFKTDWFRKKLENFTKKSSQDEFAVKEALYTIKSFYNEEMDKHFKSNNNNNFLEPSALIELHEKYSAAAVNSCREDHDLKLTYNQKKQLQEAMKIAYKKYEEKNFMRKQSSCSPAIGIDLGTTYSCVAVYKNGKVEVIFNEQGNRTTPSFVAFQADGSVVVGDTAKKQAYENPRNTIFDSKRLIGRSFNDEHVQENMKSWPFQIEQHNGNPRIKIQSQPNIYAEKAETRSGKKRKFINDYNGYHPEEISAQVLKKMKKTAEDYLGVQVKNAVITVPALFNERQATKNAGEMAGLNVLRIINEPTAAAIAYNLHRQDDLKRNVLVFDLGGGTFDVAILEIKRGEIEVKSVNGDPNLGGQDFDEEMMNYCIDSFEDEHEIDLAKGSLSTVEKTKNKRTACLRRIQSECEENKKALSFKKQSLVLVPNISGRLNLHVPFNRQLFEDLNQKHFDKCLEIVQLALDEAGKSKHEINDIVLVGGSTRIPKLQQMLSDFFDGRELSKDVNPDEAVALGAAIQACILNGEQIDQLKIKDVTPHSIGIKNAYGKFNIEIKKNTPIPCNIISEYYPLEKSQSAVFVQVYEGENPLANNNNLLGSFRLTGIPRNGREPIKVKIQISEEGILSVQALCERNNAKNEIVIPLYKNGQDGEEINEASAFL